MENSLKYGALPSKKDIRDYKIKTQVMNTYVLPDTVMLEPVPIKNQGIRPTCVAHAVSELIEYHNRRQEGSYTQFSTDFIYGLRFDGDYMGDGMYIRDALSKVQDYGDVDYNTMPGNSEVGMAKDKVLSHLSSLKDKAYPNRISTYYRINSVNELKYALAQDGPVVVGMWWYKDAVLKKVDNKYVYSYKEDSAKEGHAVLVIGYDNTGFIIQNSWGNYWGKKGLFWVAYDQFDLFFDIFGVTDNIKNIKQPDNFKKTVSPFINFILRLLITLLKKR